MKNDSGIRISFNEEARNDAKIKVIGVGGGGGNAVNRMEVNSRLSSEMRERTLAQQELNEQSERTVRELTKRSNRATNLIKMAELLQSCASVEDAFPVIAGMPTAANEALARSIRSSVGIPA